MASILVVIPGDEDLVILHRSEMSQYSETTTPIILNAHSIAKTRIRVAKEYNRRFASQYQFANLPTPNHFPISFSDIVSASLDVSFNVGTISIDLVALLQAYINQFLGKEATHVIVQTFSELVSNGETLYELNISLLTKGAAIIGRPPVNRYNLENQLSVFFVSELVESSTDCDRTLCPSMLPPKASQLASLAATFDALGSLKNVGPCEETQSNQQCLEKLRRVLTDITDGKEGRTVAEFGLFLVELQYLKELINTSGTTDRIADALQAINKHHSYLTTSSREGKYFARLLASEEDLKNFLGKNGFKDLKLSSPFLSTFPHFLEGRENYQSGNVASALEQYEMVDDAPSWFSDFLETYKHISRVRIEPKSIDAADKALHFLSNEKLQIAPFFRAAVLAQAIRAKVSSNHRLTDGDRESLFRRSEAALAIAVGNTSKRHDNFGARIERVRNLFAFGKTDQAENEIKEVERKLSAYVDKREFRLALMSAALYFAESSQYDKAKTWLHHAAVVEPRNICVFAKAPEFKAMRESDPHGIAQWMSEVRQLTQPEC